MLSTRWTIISDQKYEIPDLDNLLKHKKIRKIWQEFRNPTCKGKQQ
jgi:hypothetical protein